MHAMTLRSVEQAVPVALGSERVLWLFGNCLVDDHEIANCIGLQRGLDPATAEMEIFHGTSAEGRPTPFVPSEDGSRWGAKGNGSWLVPVDAVAVEDGVLAIFDRFYQPSESILLGFLGQVAVKIVVSELGQPQVTSRRAFGRDESFAIGTALLCVPGMVYGFRDAHDGAVIRWAIADLRGDALPHPETLQAAGWSREPAPPPQPARAFPDFEERDHAVTRLADGRYARVELRGGTLRLATSRTLSGPFVDVGVLYRPPDAYSVTREPERGIQIGSVAYYPGDPAMGLIVVYVVVRGPHVAPELRFMRVLGL